jgi:hypothetical protein
MVRYVLDPATSEGGGQLSLQINECLGAISFEKAFRYQIFETLIIWYQVVIKLFTKDYLFSPWAQVKPKLDFKSKHQLSGREC